VDNEQKAACIQSQVVCANCELEVLKVSLSLAYREKDKKGVLEISKDIINLPQKFGLTSNQVLSFLTGA